MSNSASNTTSTLTVYSRPRCVHSAATYRDLDAAGIQYEGIDLAEDIGAREYALSFGFLEAPVVVVTAPDGRVAAAWGGYQPKNLALFIASCRSESAEPARS
ncbi:hypothetical protein CHO01_31940 [Cellulomonas hominis]|uniref:Glutaredoxin-like protein NrdH n=1 Tax=Cellulomonas hominis TaxID=156981 RepID=A0A511FJR3_9CELL|nr:glutaredoxin family protein [Cellulomonas hominis]MBB5474854.1 glutaredoxin-like protein NrdH [Cellulomonas hominis]NKY05940.1 NrdH-redoxin [Cellulomonas hominis]GEL48078.1 hypothetical protein CHO01_31940 [Cellulomonas hominis]